jgi:hypothetical protein
MREQRDNKVLNQGSSARGGRKKRPVVCFETNLHIDGIGRDPVELLINVWGK